MDDESGTIESYVDFEGGMEYVETCTNCHDVSESVIKWS